jgi:hypothetical protein
MQGELAGTVWANYRLVTTQWPNPTSTGVEFLPNSVTNTTMETYVQTFADCMGCHTIAQTAGTDSKGNAASANFSFLLPQAQATNAPRSCSAAGGNERGVAWLSCLQPVRRRRGRRHTR